MGSCQVFVLEPQTHLTVGITRGEEADDCMSVHVKYMWEGDLQCVSENRDVEVPSGKQSLQHGHDLGLAELHAVFHAFFIHPFLSKLILVSCQPPGFPTCRQAREDEVAQDSDRQTDAAVDDEQPPPSRHSSDPIQVRVRSSLHVPSEHNSGIVANVPDTSSFIKLVWTIPGGEDVKRARCDRSLQDSKEESSAVYRSSVLHPTLTEGKDGPQDLTGWDEVSC